MKQEKSCGAVVFTRENGAIRYVIIESIYHFLGFPKGHVEDGETEEATARREVLEETGLAVSLIDGFRMEDKYSFRIGSEILEKQVVYFLGEYEHQVPRAQESELSAIYLFDYNTALASLKFDTQKEILRAAHERVMKEHKNLCTREQKAM